jgi:hypothetical protein
MRQYMTDRSVIVNWTGGGDCHIGVTRKSAGNEISVVFCEELTGLAFGEPDGGDDASRDAFAFNELSRIQFSNSRKPIAVIPGWSAGPDPESRDSGFDASHRPGMTESGLLRSQ